MLKDFQLVYNLNGPGSFTYEVPAVGGVVKGFDNLVQRVTKKLLTAKGSNFYIPELGSGFYGTLGATLPNNEEKIKNILPIFVTELLNQFKQEQLDAELEGVSLDDNEYIVNLELIKAEYDAVFAGWVLSLQVTTKSNQQIKIQYP